MQVMLVRLIQQVEHSGMLRIPGGAYATLWLVQHEVPGRFSGLQDVLIQLDTAECIDFVARIADDLPIDLDALLNHEQANLLAVELGQVAQKTVYTHSDQSQGIQPNILREVLRLRWLQLAQNFRAARTETRQITLFNWQGTDDFWVDSHAVAPAGLAQGVRVGLGAVVTGATGWAKVGRGHFRCPLWGRRLLELW